ncbi:glycosyltransferase family protein [Sedimentitalea todarodis]|uniref:Glycosyltransferase n=1 Tax=Sedimentitalea todarodis TaxID=1631240 RepID=A0ABU3V855_9RHOB|nr:glycosyltransferase [Sedimentitalea todarodis]MDU9002293.1 glycosyltransferase [Sedimentitalea todarodis]
MKVMIVVTHLLGTGHLRRALVLADAFSSAGHRVLLASGGMPLDVTPPAKIRILQLPPLRSDGVNFSRLLDDAGRPADEALFARRRTLLCEALTDFAPDILITELFPFGRRVLSAEFSALLGAAHALAPRPVILSSIRDILAPPSKPSKADRAQELITNLYDAVLVHSDPHSTTLDQSWPVSGALSAKLHYTGYVTQPPPTPHPEGTGASEILVSAGGGNVGTDLFETAIAAARHMPERRWRLLVAGDRNRVATLRDLANHSATIVEPARSDFRNMLAGAAASVSLCGYNTAMDVLQTRTPVVFVPFDDGNEVEQSLRARSLSSLAGITTLHSKNLTPDALCSAVRQVLDAPRRAQGRLRFDGAAQSVAIATGMAEARK